MAISSPKPLEVEYFSVCKPEITSIWKIILVNRKFVQMASSSSFLDSGGQTIAVIGGAGAAAEAVRLLRAAGANVRWYSTEVDVAEEVFLAYPPPGWLELTFADPLAGDLVRFAGIVSAAGAPLDDAVSARARASGVPVQVIARPDLSSARILNAEVSAPVDRPASWITGRIGACWKSSRARARDRDAKNGAVQ
jgi:hypothetical protein